MRVDGQLQECKYRDALTIIAKKVEVIKVNMEMIQ